MILDGTIYEHMSPYDAGYVLGLQGLHYGHRYGLSTDVGDGFRSGVDAGYGSYLVNHRDNPKPFEPKAPDYLRPALSSADGGHPAYVDYIEPVPHNWKKWVTMLDASFFLQMKLAKNQKNHMIVFDSVPTPPVSTITDAADGETKDASVEKAVEQLIEESKTISVETVELASV
jgi:hypothetical protein